MVAVVSYVIPNSILKDMNLDMMTIGIDIDTDIDI